MTLFQRLPLVTISCFSIAVYAGEFRVVREQGRLFLETKKCESLRDEVEAIALWTRSLGEHVDPIKIDCEKEALTRIDISVIVPPQFRDLSGKHALCYGPNCFNAALIGHGMHKLPRSVGSSEMTLTLELFCRDLSDNNEPPLPGDIGVIRNRLGKRFEEVHAFNYIRQTVATKNGESISATLQIQDRDEMFEAYGVSEKCRDPYFSARCVRYVGYFRCNPELVKPEDAKDFDAMEHALAESLYNKDKAGELSALIDLFELVQSGLGLEQSKIVKAKIESIEYQLKRMEPEEEEFLKDIIKLKKQDKYHAVRGFLERAMKTKASGKSYPFLFRPVLQAIMDASLTDFDEQMKRALPDLSPGLKKKVIKHLKLPDEDDEDL